MASLLALLTLLPACSGPAQPVEFTAQDIAAPTSEAASSPRLASGPDGQLLLSWLDTGEITRLRFVRLGDAGWSGSATVIAAENLLVNWADLPSVVPLGEDHLAAHWLVMSGVHSHAYDIAFAESRDNGVSWTEATTPHDDGTATEHGFVSIFAADNGAGLLWLDGRNMVNDFSAADPAASGMTLRSNTGVVDELVCDCCQTDVAIAATGPVAVYRDRSIDEIRDIYVARQIDGQWLPGTAIANDGWKIAGCPVNGPAISANGEKVAVAWYTAAQEPVVYVALSNNSGASFSAPIEIVRNATLGRVAIAILDHGDVAVSWLESADPVASIVNVRRVSSNRELGPVRSIANTASGLSVPQMARHGANLVFAWTESGQGSSRIATARIAVDSL